MLQMVLALGCSRRHVHALKLLIPVILHYLASLLHRHTPCRTLRSASANLLSVTRCTLSFGTRGFRTAAPTIWNSLPANVRSSATLSTFRRHLKSHSFRPVSPLPSDQSQRLWFYDHGAIQIYFLTYLLTYLLTCKCEVIQCNVQIKIKHTETYNQQ